MNIKPLALVLCIFLITSNLFANQWIPITFTKDLSEHLTIHTSGSSGPLSNCKVIIESKDGSLLGAYQSSNEGTVQTDLSQDKIESGVHITAIMENHVSISILNNKSMNISMNLPKKSSTRFALINGQVSGYQERQNEGQVNIAMISKGLEMSDLMQFDTSAFMSPFKDKIKLGFLSWDIPSNLSVPAQRVSLYGVPIQLSKPGFRLPTLLETNHRYFAITGIVDAKSAIDAGNDIWKLIPVLNIKSAGISANFFIPNSKKTESEELIVSTTSTNDELPVPDIENQLPQVSLDIDANQTISEFQKIHSGLNTTPSETLSNRLLVSLWQPAAGFYVPVHFQIAENNQDLTMNLINKSQSRLMDLIISKDGLRFRLEWIDFDQKNLPNAGLTSDLFVNKWYQTWKIGGASSAQWMMAHLEDNQKTVIGSQRYEDLWILVGPRQNELNLPVVATRELHSRLSATNSVSVDLIEVKNNILSDDFVRLEKVRIKLE